MRWADGCLPERRAPLDAEVVALMREVWREYCQRPYFAKSYADICARAAVSDLRACGSAVRENYWVLLKPRPHPAVVRAAARFASRLARDGYVPYRLLVQRAVEEFVEILAGGTLNRGRGGLLHVGKS